MKRNRDYSTGQMEALIALVAMDGSMRLTDIVRQIKEWREGVASAGVYQALVILNKKGLVNQDADTGRWEVSDGGRVVVREWVDRVLILIRNWEKIEVAEETPFE